MPQLDMKLVALDPKDGQCSGASPIAQAVPDAASNYGYSETSAPICANHRVVVGAAGSEYGVRGFVMAYNDATSRPRGRARSGRSRRSGTSGARLARIVGGGVGLDAGRPSTRTTNTLYFGTGSATPLYFPELRPGRRTRARTR